MVTMDQIKTNIVEAIRNSGMKQKDLADKLHVRQQTISCYLIKKALPSLDTLANLCNILGVSPNEILCYKEFEKNTD